MKAFRILLISHFVCLSAMAQSNAYFQDLENFRENNLALKTQNSKLSAADDLLLSRKLFWTPTIALSAGRTKTNLNPELYDKDYWQADASLNLFKGGVDSALLDQAKASQKSQGLSLNNEDLRTQVTASDLVFQAIYLKELLRIQEELYKQKEESLKVIKDRYSQGKTPFQEVAKSEVDLAQQKNRARLAAVSLAENEMFIQSQFVSSIKTQSWPFDNIDALNLQSGKQFSNEFLPSVEEKYWQSKKDESAWKAAQRSFWPSVDLTFQYQEFSPTSIQTYNQWTSMITISLPLWSRYETQAAASSAHAYFIEADNNFRSAEKSAQIKKQFLAQKLELSRLNLSEAKANLDKSRGLYSDLMKSFRLGRISTNDLFIEQNRLLDSERDFSLSQLTFHQTLVESCVLQGYRVQNCLAR